MTIHDDMILSSPGRFAPDLAERQDRPWFLGEAPAPTEEPSDEQGRAAMRAELVTNPLIRVLASLLEFIGEGRRVTKQGRLFAVDRRELIAQIWPGRNRDYDPDACGVENAWTLLLSNGWLALADGQVRPAEAPPFPGGFDADAEHYLEACRLAFASVLETDDVGPYGWGARYADDDVLEALLIATSPTGLTLPDHPVDGTIVHCREMVRLLVDVVRHPWIRDVPINRSTGHIESAALRHLARCGEALWSLPRRGVVAVEEEPHELPTYEQYSGAGYVDPPTERDHTTRFLAPVVMRGAVALVRERRRALDAGYM